MRLVEILRFVCVEELKQVAALQEVLHPQACLTDPGEVEAVCLFSTLSSIFHVFLMEFLHACPQSGIKNKQPSASAGGLVMSRT